MQPTEKEFTIVRYTSAHEKVWNEFVTRSKNGTFLFFRCYMDYHADRFDDCSLLVYQGEKLLALLPGHVKDGVYGSHNGLTYGGFVLGNVTYNKFFRLVNEVLAYLHREVGVERMIYRPVPYIYHTTPAQEDLYALFRLDARLTERKISTVVEYANPMPVKPTRRQHTRQALKHGFTVVEDEDYAAFWKVLEENLHNRHQTTPVHSLAEIELLHGRLPQHIRLFRVLSPQGETVAGSVMYVSRSVAHAQYTASTPEGRRWGAVDYLYSHLIYEVFSSLRYFDYGTSVEQGGRFLNETLLSQKEDFGGRAVVYDTYELNLTDF